MIVIGIDPGISGALAVVDGERHLLGVWDTPATDAGRRQYLDREMVSLLLEASQLGACRGVFVEAQGPRPKQGCKASYGTGLGFGLWRGIIAATGLPLYVVSPQTWQRSAYSGVTGEGKERSFIAAQRLFPDIELTKPKSRKLTLDGRADAALIAVYGLTNLKGELQ